MISIIVLLFNKLPPERILQLGILGLCSALERLGKIFAIYVYRKISYMYGWRIIGTLFRHCANLLNNKYCYLLERRNICTLAGVAHSTALNFKFFSYFPCLLGTILGQITSNTRSFQGEPLCARPVRPRANILQSRHTPRQSKNVVCHYITLNFIFDSKLPQPHKSCKLLSFFLMAMSIGKFWSPLSDDPVLLKARRLGITSIRYIL